MEISAYIFFIFGLANLFYFLFSNGKEIKRKFWLIVTVFCAISLITAVFLSLISSDSLVDNVLDFFIFIISSIVVTVAVLLYHLKLHMILNESSFFSKNYIIYVLSFSFFSFFINFLFFIFLYITASLIFGIE